MDQIINKIGEMDWEVWGGVWDKVRWGVWEKVRGRVENEVNKIRRS